MFWVETIWILSGDETPGKRCFKQTGRFGLNQLQYMPTLRTLYRTLLPVWTNNTYLLTPWSRVLLQKLTGFAANQEIPRILWNPKVHYRTTYISENMYSPTF
jgi:hypothetical protein